MHESVLRWMTMKVDILGLAQKSILEVGSYNVNGTVRPLFSGPYVGLDMTAGPGVDVVGVAKALPFQDAEFEVVVSTEMLEHDATFWLSLAEMGRVLKEGGELFLTFRGMRLNGMGFHYHGDTHFKDVYRFLPDSVPTLMQLAGCEVVEFSEDPQVPGLFVHGKKRSK